MRDASSSRKSIASVGALLLLLAACGDDSEGDARRTGREPVADGGDASTGEPVRVGVLVNVTGPLRLGEHHALAVLQGWETAVNADGGVAGHPVEILVEDTKGEPSTSTAAAQRLVDDETIDALIIYDVQGEQFFTETLIQSGLPVIGGMGFMPTSWGVAPNWLPLHPSFTTLINSGMVLADSIGASRTAMVLCSEAPACADAGPVAEAASEALGMEFAGMTLVAASAPDYTGECLQLIDSGVDFIAAAAATMETTMRFVADCHQQGYDGSWGMFGTAIVADIMAENDPGVAVDLALMAFPWFADDPAVEAYRRMMTDQGVADESWGDIHGTSAYATVELLRTALEQGPPLPPEPTPESIVAAYGTLEEETLDGLLAQPITFTPGEAQPMVTCYWLGRFEGGQFTDADLDAPVCDPPALGAPEPRDELLVPDR